MILERDLVVFKGDVFAPAGQTTQLTDHRTTGYTRVKGYIKIVGPPPVGPGPHAILDQGYGSCAQPSGYVDPGKDVYSGVAASGTNPSLIDLAVCECAGWAVKNLTATNFVVRVCLVLSVFPSQFD
jgi:hypothetical protein